MVAFMDTTRIQVHLFFGVFLGVSFFTESGDNEILPEISCRTNPTMEVDGSDDFPFQTGDFQVPAVSFPGCS